MATLVSGIVFRLATCAPFALDIENPELEGAF